MPDFMLDPEILDRFRRLGVALAIGLLIGIERGWKERGDPEGSRTAGVRTFTLIGLMGGVVSLLASELGAIVLGLGFLGVTGALASFEILHARRTGSSDATTLVAALLTFTLAALAALGYVHAAAAAAVAAAIVLVFKEGLHRWLERVTFAELRAGVALAAMTVIVLPLLPEGTIDPWGALSLRAVWLLTVMIAAISFVGYAAIRIAGTERGPLIAGLAGGLVSSTATTLSFARMARGRPEAADPIIAGALLASAVMFVRVGVVASVLRIELAAPLAAAFGPAAAVTAGFAAWHARRGRRGGAANGESAGAVLALKNPLALGSALVFGVLLAAVSVAAAALEATFGAQGVYALAAVSGLADVDAITLSMTQATRTAVEIAARAVVIAVAVNTLSKAGLAALAGGPRVGRDLSVAAAGGLAAGVVGYLAYIGATGGF